jgi:hypothetical protein
MHLSRWRGVADTVGDKSCVFLSGLYPAERGIAERLLQLGAGKLPWPWIDPEKAIPWVEQRTGVLAQSQRSAVALALTSKALVITGGPRVGCGSDACEGDAQGRLEASGRGVAMGTTAAAVVVRPCGHRAVVRPRA